MKFQIYVWMDEDDKFIVECPSLPGCVSDGETYDEAIENIREAIVSCVQLRKELGMYCPT